MEMIQYLLFFPFTLLEQTSSFSIFEFWQAFKKSIKKFFRRLNILLKLRKTLSKMELDIIFFGVYI